MKMELRISRVCFSLIKSCTIFLILQAVEILALKEGHQISISLANALCNYTKFPQVVKLVLAPDFEQGIQVYSKGWDGDTSGYLHKNLSSQFILITEDSVTAKNRKKRNVGSQPSHPPRPRRAYPPPTPPPKRPCQKKDLELGTGSQINFEVVNTRTNNASVYALVLRPQLPWAQAMYACATHGMILTDVRNNDELNFLNSFLYDFVDATKPSVEIWIGGSRFRGGVDKRQATWFEGTLNIQDSVWNQGENDDVEKKENCVMLENRVPPVFQATDITCEGCRPFICKSLI